MPKTTQGHGEKMRYYVVSEYTGLLVGARATKKEAVSLARKNIASLVLTADEYAAYNKLNWAARHV